MGPVKSRGRYLLASELGRTFLGLSSASCNPVSWMLRLWVNVGACGLSLQSLFLASLPSALWKGASKRDVAFQRFVVTLFTLGS